MTRVSLECASLKCIRITLDGALLLAEEMNNLGQTTIIHHIKRTSLDLISERIWIILMFRQSKIAYIPVTLSVARH